MIGEVVSICAREESWYAQIDVAILGNCALHLRGGPCLFVRPRGLDFRFFAALLTVVFRELAIPRTSR